MKGTEAKDGFGGRGWRNRCFATGRPGWMRSGASPSADAAYAPLDPETEKQILKRQADALQSQLASIRNRLARMEDDGGGNADGR